MPRARDVSPLINRLSVIVTTYNRPQHLERCLASLEVQTVPPDEVIIADDGSIPEHTAAFRRIAEASPLNVKCARQEHDGFRLAANRNNGVRNSSGDYLFFTDADAVLFPEVLEVHIRAAGRKQWVGGYVIYLTKDETEALTVEDIRLKRLDRFRCGKPDEYFKCMKGTQRKFAFWSFLARVLPFEPVYRQLSHVGCHLSLFRADFEAVNGYDENFRGWGNEDDDLSLRLQIAGIRGVSVRKTARMYHLYHEPAPKPLLRHGRYVGANYPYHKRWRWGKYRCERGLVDLTGAPPAIPSEDSPRRHQDTKNM